MNESKAILKYYYEILEYYLQVMRNDLARQGSKMVRGEYNESEAYKGLSKIVDDGEVDA